MEENYKKSSDSDEASGGEPPVAEQYVIPGVPIVRTSTPRPLPFMAPAKSELPLAPSGPAAHFPVEAPDAPPLPEVPAGAGEAQAKEAAPSTPGSEQGPSEAGPEARQVGSEFIWLFEYALDMDPVLLNRPDRLNGSAFAYGPAVLKGYRLVFEGLEGPGGHVIASLEEARDQPGAEVWGILYRVPRRFTSASAGEMPLLDKVHLAGNFVPLEVQVREPYRQRELRCITYVASPTTRKQVNQLPPEDRVPEPAYLKRLLQVARRQKLPASYLSTLEELVPAVIPAATALPTTPPEQNTDPLPAVVLGRDVPRRASRSVPVEEETPGTRVPVEWRESRPDPWDAPRPVGLDRLLKLFGLYICLLLLGTLALAIFQGLAFWPDVFNNSFLPLGIPWYVLLYGLLGGCVSCILSLNRPVTGYPPTFVVLTWFVRPFLGSIFGALAYLVLTSGIILLSAQPAQHFALCSALGALAGLCEGKILLRRSWANG
jgi:hypothetical protein